MNLYHRRVLSNRLDTQAPHRSRRGSPEDGRHLQSNFEGLVWTQQIENIVCSTEKDTNDRIEPRYSIYAKSQTKMATILLPSVPSSLESRAASKPQTAIPCDEASCDIG